MGLKKVQDGTETRESQDEWVEACTRVLESDPSDQERNWAYEWRGTIYLALKNYRQSAADLDEFFAHFIAYADPSQTNQHKCVAYDRRAADNYFMGNYEAALSDLNQSDALADEYRKTHPYMLPHPPAWHYAMRGDIALQRRQYSAAVDQYELSKQSGNDGLSAGGMLELAQHLKFARQMATNPTRAPSASPPPTSSPVADACKLYPNLCP
jgi:tetratricopeptide (TPR) repeat protein